MMNTAMVLSVGTELGATRSGTSEQEGGEGMTFAESFGESAGLSIDRQGKGGAGTLVNDSKEGLSKNLEKSEPATNASRGELIAGQGMKEPEVSGKASRQMSRNSPGNASAVKNSILVPIRTEGKVSDSADEHRLTTSSESLQVLAMGSGQVTIPQRTMTVRPEKAEDTLQPCEKGGAVESSLPALKFSTEVDLKNLKIAPREDAGVLNRSLESESSGKKKVGTEKKSEAATSTKKTEKENVTSGLKTDGEIEDVKGAEGLLPGGIGGQASIPVQGQSLPLGDGQKNDDGKRSDSGEVLATNGNTVGGTDVSRSKEIGTGKKNVDEGTVDAVNTVASQASLAKSDGDGSTSAGIETPTGKDGATSLVAAIVAHVGPGGSGAASEIVTGVSVGHTSGDAAGGKIQAGTTVAHATSLQSGAGDQGNATGAAEIGGMHRILTATPTALEVGVANGTQGWLKIRAEMTEGGQVNASLSSASISGQEILHRELPALTAYLHQERVSVNAVVVQTSAAADTGSMPGGAMNPEGREQQREQQGGGEQRQGVTTDVDSGRVDSVMAYEGLNGLDQDGSLSSGIFPGGGGYLNVRA